jgi:hypothetical protein
MQHGLFLVLLILKLSSSLQADDPLNALPTESEPLPKKLEKLTKEQQQAIALPKQPKQIVLSLALVAENAEKTEPWLTVTADGLIDCIVPMPMVTKRRQDQLAQEELQWLLHLAVNECRGFERDTETLQKDFAAKPSMFADGLPKNRLVYRLHLQAAAHEFALPEAALVVRPTRSRMQLGAFASLQTYAKFLVSRAYLGTTEEQTSILLAVNEQLQREQQQLHPLVVPPPFAIEHLTSAFGTDQNPLLASFQQEVPLGDKKYQRITATIIKSGKDEKPQIMIRSMALTKSR